MVARFNIFVNTFYKEKAENAEKRNKRKRNYIEKNKDMKSYKKPKD